MCGGELACLKDFVQTQGIGSLRVMEATEYDPDQFLKTLETELGVKTEIIPNDQFMVNRQEFAEWFNSADDTSMEAFYRKRRRETGVLMQEDQPLGGDGIMMPKTVSPQPATCRSRIPLFSSRCNHTACH
ncbi:MAG: cryptochrome/photolyase family protein [Candidatus Omnitrophica bacterium]|nr:cryptochrome/photolyase family protein [Candidatus Omnitrophota bacterium]